MSRGVVFSYFCRRFDEDDDEDFQGRADNDKWL